MGIISQEKRRQKQPQITAHAPCIAIDGAVSRRLSKTKEQTCTSLTLVDLTPVILLIAAEGRRRLSWELAR